MTFYDRIFSYLLEYFSQGRQTVKQAIFTGVLMIGAMFLVGCSGPGQTIPMAVDMKAVPDPPKVRNAPHVAVVPFEDARPDKTSIGRRQHYVETTVDRYVAAEGSASEQITKFVVDYLKQAGFPVTVVQAGAQPAAGSADVILSGQIESYWNEAVGRVARTELSSKNRLRIKLTNLADNSTTFFTVAGEGTTKVVTFDLGDLAQLDGEALGQSLGRFLSDLSVVNRSLKPKQEG
jgi:hypothetical protein